MKSRGKPRLVYRGSCKDFAYEGVTESVWLRRVYGGSYKTFPFRSCQSVKIGRRLARNARFQAPTCLLLSLWLSSSVAVSMGEATKPFLFEVVEMTPTCLLLSLWLRRVYGGSYKAFRCPLCQTVKIGGCLAQNAQIETLTKYFF